MLNQHNDNVLFSNVALRRILFVLKNIREHIALLAVSIIYGLNFIIAKEVMPEYIQPFGFILLRVVTASVFFFAFAAFVVQEKIQKEDWFRLFLCGLTGVALNQLFFFKGLNLTTPINASLIMITTPISVLLLAYFIIREKITWQKSIGVLLGASGALLIIFGKKDFQVQMDNLWGDLFVLMNAFFYAVYLVIVKPLMSKYHPLTVIKWVFLLGLTWVLPAGFSELNRVVWQSFTPLIWMYVAFVLICTTILAYLLNIYAMRKVSPAVVGIYIYVQPVIATLLSLLLGKDELSGLKIVAALLIFSGVYLASVNRWNFMPKT